MPVLRVPARVVAREHHALAALGLSSIAQAIVSFPDGSSGDYWLLDEDDPRVAEITGRGMMAEEEEVG